MNLVFEDLLIQHFRCFAEPDAIYLAPSEGLIFLRGRNDAEPALGANGAGKSSIWGALCWCLYGKTPSGLRSPDIKPWKGKGVPHVVLHLNVDGKLHTITRKATTNGLMIDYEQVAPDEPAKLIGLSYEAFTNTILLAQGQPLFFDRTPKEKLALLTDVLQLERWEARSALAAKKSRELEDLEREMVGEALGLGVALERAREALEKAKAEGERWEQERQERAQGLAVNLKEAEALLTKLQARHAEADLALDGAGTELKALRRKEQANQDDLNKATQAHLRAENALDTLCNSLEEKEAELAALAKAKTCPTCGQSIAQKDLPKHKAELEKEIKELTKQGSTAQKTAEKLSADRSALQRTANQTQYHIANFQDLADAAQNALNTIMPSMAQAQAAVSTLRSEKGSATEQTNPYRNQITAARASLQQTETQERELQEDLSKARQKLERTRYWVKGFRDIQLYLIDEALQELSAVTNVLLAEIGLLDWRVEYAVEKETKSGTIQQGLSVVIHSPINDTPVRWESWSGGEGQRLRLVGALALSEVLLNRAGVVPNIEVLDEPTRHLSAEGVEDLCSYLRDRAAQSGRTVWFIDHTARNSNNFARVVTVVKKVKGSVIQTVV